MMTNRDPAEKLVRDIKRRTRKKYSVEQKIRIVLEWLYGEESIAELCRREGLNSNVYYRCSKEFMEAGKKNLADGSAHEATSDKVKELRAQASALKETQGWTRSQNSFSSVSLIKYSYCLPGALDTMSYMRSLFSVRVGFRYTRLLIAMRKLSGSGTCISSLKETVQQQTLQRL